MWLNTSGGNWNVPANWSASTVPTNSTFATISQPGTYTVTLNTSQQAATLTLDSQDAILLIQGGSLSLAGNNASSVITLGTLELNGGVIQAVNAASTHTLTNDYAIQAIGGGNYIRGNGTGFVFINNGSLGSSGGGTLTIGGYSTDTLTNNAQLVANQGTINFGAGGSAWSNSSGGELSAANNGILNLGTAGTSWSAGNSGTIEADSGGTVNFLGNFTTANLDGFTSIIIGSGGGTFNLIGNLNNSAGSLSPPIGGSYVLDGGTVAGGTVTSGALVFSTSAGVLNNVIVSGTYGMPANAYVFVAGTTTLNGGSVSWAGNNTIYGGAANATLLNQGMVSALGGNINGDGYSGFMLNNSGTITNGGSSSTTLYLANDTGDTLANSGTIQATSSAGNHSTVSIGWTGGGGTTINNSGLLEASGPNSTLNLGYSSAPLIFSNTGGTITATAGGTVDFYGAFTNAELAEGAINGAGGTLNLDGTLNITGTLAPPTDSLSGGIFTLDGGTINGGTVTSNALQFSTSAGVLNNVIVSGNYGMPTNAYFYIKGTTTLSGGTETWAGNNTIYGDAANATLSNQGTVSALGGSIDGGGNTGYTLNNSGTITNGGSGSTTLYLADYTGDTLTNSGTIQATSTAGNYSSVAIGWTGSGGTTITNMGTLEANGPNSKLYLGYGSTPLTFSNTGGTITATAGGAVDFYGTFTNAELAEGTINGAGGTLNLDGKLNITGTLVPPTDSLSGGIFTLDGGTINGGTVTSNALQFSTSAGVLSNVIVSGNYGMPTNAYFYITGTTTLSGGTETWAGNNTIYGGAASATLLNQGTVNALGGNINGDGYSGFMLNNSGTITNGGSSSTTLYLANDTGDTLANSGTIQATSTAGNYSTVSIGWTGSGGTTINNSGLLEASGPNSTLNLGYGSAPLTFSNTGGTITATAGGTVDFYGAFTNAELAEGAINGAGGKLNLDGTLNITGTLAPPTDSLSGGIFTLDGGTINGGTVTSNALQFSNSAGVLNNVIVSGNYGMPTNAYFYIKGTTTLSGGTETWAGNNTIYGGAANAMLLNQGMVDALGGSIDGGGNTGYTLNNSGTITNGGSGSTTLYLADYTGDTLTNSGTIQATSTAGNYSSVAIGWTGSGGTTITNMGTLEANGPNSTLYLGYSSTPLNFSNTGGTIMATAGGAVDFYGTFTNAELAEGTINGAGGKLNLNGTLNITGSLAAPASGIFTLDGGTVNGGAVASGALTFSNNGGTLLGVAMAGNFNVPPGAYFTVGAGTTFGGNMTFSGNNDIYLNSAPGVALTIGPGQTWTGAGYLNTYAEHNGLTVSNQGTMNLLGGEFGGDGYTGFVFNNSGTIADTNAQLTLSGYFGDALVNSGAITSISSGGNYSYLYLGGNTNGTVTNSGLIDYVTSGGGYSYIYIGDDPGTTLTNTGTIEANGPGVVSISYPGSQVTNLPNNTLTGGTWIAAGGGILEFDETANAIVTNDATLVLNGAGSMIETETGVGPSFQNLEQTLTTNNGTLEVLGGRNFAAGNPIVNSGTIQLGGGTLTAASLTNGSGGKLSGFGTFSPTGGVTLGSGVTVSPGSAVANGYLATLNFNSLTLGAGGAYTFDVAFAGGTAGSGYDTVNVTGGLNVASGPFAINLESINTGTGAPGLATFNPATSYQLTLFSSSALTGFSAADFTVNTASFSNGLGGGAFSVASVGNNIVLNFTPVPEPSTWALMAAGVSALAYVAWRRRPAARA